MYISDKDINEAFFRSPLPSEANSGILDEYIVLMEIIGKDFYDLRKSLSDAHLKKVCDCFDAFHMHSRLISYFYFEQGWLAAKEDNKLDHY